MDYKFFTKDGGHTYLDMASESYLEEAHQLVAQGFIEQSLILTADSPQEAEAIFNNEHQGFFKKLNMLLGPFFTSGYHRG